MKSKNELKLEKAIEREKRQEVRVKQAEAEMRKRESELKSIQQQKSAITRRLRWADQSAERKKRTHRLILIGAAFCKTFGDMSPDDAAKLMTTLKSRR